jgi:hypothetical protein
MIGLTIVHMIGLTIVHMIGLTIVHMIGLTIVQVVLSADLSIVFVNHGLFSGTAAPFFAPQPMAFMTRSFNPKG